MPRKFSRLISGFGMALQPHLAPDGTWFVFAAEVAGSYHIIRQRMGGETPMDLTKDSKANCYEPAISPDGQRIAFRSDRDGGGIEVIGATGESVRRVTHFGFTPSWSPDGTRLLVSTISVDNPTDRTQKGEAWVVRVESGEKQRIEAGDDAFQGAWSPHGLRMAFSGTRQLFTVPAGGGPPKVLFDAARASVWTPAWSPDGSYLYYSSSVSGVLNIGRIAVDEATGEPRGQPEEVTRGVGVALSHPSFSHDGSRMVFQAHSLDSNIERVRLDSTGMLQGSPIPVTRGDNAFIFPDVSPDGRWLTFCTAIARSDVEENIYVAHVDGSEQRALTTDKSKRNRLPRWSTDGKQVIFYSDRSGPWAAWSIGADGAGLTRLATEEPKRIESYTLPSRVDGRVLMHIGEDLGS